MEFSSTHDDVTNWKHFPRHWPFVRGIHRSAVNSPHKVQWRRALVFSLICAWTNDRANNLDAGDLRRHRLHNEKTTRDFSGHWQWHYTMQTAKLHMICSKFLWLSMIINKLWLTKWRHSIQPTRALKMWRHLGYLFAWAPCPVKEKCASFASDCGTS